MPADSMFIPLDLVLSDVIGLLYIPDAEASEDPTLCNSLWRSAHVTLSVSVN